MVVEDHEDTRDAIAEILLDEGFAVVTAGNGVQALEQMRDGVRPSVILLDIALPVMNGIEFLRARRLRPFASRTPVLLLSGMGDDLHGLLGERLDVRGFLRKPIDAPRLIEEVRRFSGERAGTC